MCVCHVSLILAFPVNIQGAHRVSAPHWNVSPWSPRSATWDTRTSPVRKMEDGLWRPGPPCHGSKDWKIQDILVGGFNLPL